MKELTNPVWIKVKGLSFLIIGLASAILIMLEHPALKTGVLLAITVWCFCRFYYFAFYVIQHYVDDQYRFSGLWSFGGYLWRRRKKPGSGSESATRQTVEGGGRNAKC